LVVGGDMAKPPTNNHYFMLACPAFLLFASVQVPQAKGESERNLDARRRQELQQMTLSSDGKVLTVDYFIDDNRGSFELKRVYNEAG
jgi:hypothetical protein